MGDAVQEIKYAFSSLEIGQLYPIVAIQRTSTQYDGRMIDGIKATLDCEDFLLFTYLPRNFLKTSDDRLKKINAAVKSKEKEKKLFHLCNYGQIGNQSIGRIHDPGQGVDEKLLKNVAKYASSPSSSPMKRTASASFSDNEGSPSKMKSPE